MLFKLTATQVLRQKQTVIHIFSLGYIREVLLLTVTFQSCNDVLADTTLSSNNIWLWIACLFSLVLR